MRFSQVKSANSEQEVNTQRLTQQVWKIHTTTHCVKGQAGPLLPGELRPQDPAVGMQMCNISLQKSPCNKSNPARASSCGRPCEPNAFQSGALGTSRTDEIKEKSATKVLMKGCAN